MSPTGLPDVGTLGFDSYHRRTGLSLREQGFGAVRVGCLTEWELSTPGATPLLIAPVRAGVSLEGGLSRKQSSEIDWVSQVDNCVFMRKVDFIHKLLASPFQITVSH